MSTETSMHTVSFSMNGFRRNLNHDIKELKALVEDVISDNHWEEEDLVDVTNRLICMSNSLNCVSSSDDENFTDMSDLEEPLVDEGDS